MDFVRCSLIGARSELNSTETEGILGHVTGARWWKLGLGFVERGFGDLGIGC